MEEFYNESLQQGEGLDLIRYVKAAIRRWWIVVLITAAVALPWMWYLKQQPPIFEAEVWVSFDDVVEAVPANILQNREMKLRTRTFAEEVTAQLGLTLEIIQEEGLDHLKRQNLFVSFSTTNAPVSDVYEFRFYPPDYCALYAGSRLLDSLRVERCTEDTVEYNGLIFTLMPDIVDQRPFVRFRIKDFQGTTASLQSRVGVRFNDTGSLMRIWLQDPDPILVSETVNMLADIFVKKSLEMGRERRSLRSKDFRGRLSVIERDLTRTDKELRDFRRTHIMGLDDETQQTINRIAAFEGNIERMQMHIEDINNLLLKLDPSSANFESGASIAYVYRQLARLPVFVDNMEMTIKREELVDQDTRKNDLSENLPELNPEVVETNDRIQSLEAEIADLAREETRELANRITEQHTELEELEQTLEYLPEAELRYAELQRRRKINEDLYNYLSMRYNEARIAEEVDSENVSIFDPALPPDTPITAGKRQKALLGMMMGFCLGLGVVFVLEMADKSIKTHEDVKRYLKLSMIGVIPTVKFDDYELKDSEKAKSISSQIVTHDYSPTPVGEAYRALRTNLLFSRHFGEIRTLVIGSASPGEGKSFTAANLAITLAQQKSNTLIIDADLRRGVLHNSFNCPKKPGLTNYLTGVAPLERVLNETYIPNLNLITCGSLIPNPSELLGSVKMRKFIEGITKRFEFVIFDTPPLMAATDAVILGTLVDGIAVVIRARKTNRDDVLKRLEIFQNVRANVLGVILNCAGMEVAHEGYSYYRY